MQNQPLETGMRTVRTSELETLKRALETAQFYASEYKPRDADDDEKTMNEQIEIATAIDLVRAMLTR